MEAFEGVIGLEVHAHLLTKSKIFCGSSTEFGGEPNSHTCPVCMGLPGALPVLNKRVVDFAIRAGLSTNCTINRKSIFARKNYYYPDLPKGYQISQYEEPICSDGHLDIFTNGEKKRIRIKRIHMEEDAGKLVHEATIETSTYSLVDFNRSSVPLLEIVSEPDLANAPGSSGLSEDAEGRAHLPRDLRREHGGREFSVRCKRVGAAKGG